MALQRQRDLRGLETNLLLQPKCSRFRPRRLWYRMVLTVVGIEKDG
jgi:hypothetical protein